MPLVRAFPDFNVAKRFSCSYFKTKSVNCSIKVALLVNLGNFHTQTNSLIGGVYVTSCHDWMVMFHIFNSTKKQSTLNLEKK